MLFRSDAEIYDTWLACQADRARLEREEQVITSREVVGSLCTVPLDEQPGFGEPWRFRALVFFK